MEKTWVVLTLQLAICVALVVMPLTAEPHHAPVTISAPTVVAASLAAQIDALPGEPLRAGATADADQARDDVLTGRSVAAVDVDLRRNRATLFVSSAQGAGLSRAVGDVVRAAAAPFAVTVVTDDVAPLPDGSAGQRGLRLTVAAAVVLGLALAAAATWRWGPVTDTWSQAVRRVAFVVGGATLLGWCLSVGAAHLVGGPVLGWWTVLAATAVATAAATLALNAVLGAAGIGLAAMVFVVSAVPLARVEHPLLLPTPWAQVTPWLPHGAGLDAARQVAWFAGAEVARPFLVLAGWVVVSCAVLAVARRERRLAGVEWRRAATAR